MSTSIKSLLAETSTPRPSVESTRARLQESNWFSIEGGWPLSLLASLLLLIRCLVKIFKLLLGHDYTLLLCRLSSVLLLIGHGCLLRLHQLLLLMQLLLHHIFYLGQPCCVVQILIWLTTTAASVWIIVWLYFKCQFASLAQRFHLLLAWLCRARIRLLLRYAVGMVGLKDHLGGLKQLRLRF